MGLSESDFAYLRSQLGTVDRADLDQRYARLGDLTAVALEVLRERKSALVADPLTVTVQGVATVSTAENVRALERQIADLAAAASAEAGARGSLPVPLQRRRSR
ncbi:hypothetical protein [Streptomyces luteireticuli]|uniref:hypothetical protein n=1 Tax=Streptomyces luteireticuli TaxID=173858 RepID=UPI00355863EA